MTTACAGVVREWELRSTRQIGRADALGYHMALQPAVAIRWLVDRHATEARRALRSRSHRAICMAHHGGLWPSVAPAVAVSAATDEKFLAVLAVGPFT